MSSKYVVENQTGVPIEVKQRGTADAPAGPPPNDSPQPTRRLGIGERAALHWEVRIGWLYHSGPGALISSAAVVHHETHWATLLEVLPTLLR